MCISNCTPDGACELRAETHDEDGVVFHAATGLDPLAIAQLRPESGSSLADRFSLELGVSSSIILNLTVSINASYAFSSATRTLSEAFHQLKAQLVPNCGDRVWHVSLCALGCPEGCNPREA